MDGLSELIKLNPDTPAIDPILVDCKDLTHFDLLITLSDVIGRILERVKRHSSISYEIGLLGKARILDDLPKFENVKTIPEENVPDKTLFVLTLRIDGRDIIRPASYQTWDEYFMFFFRNPDDRRIMVTHPHLQARLINCPELEEPAEDLE